MDWSNFLCFVAIVTINHVQRVSVGFYTCKISTFFFTCIWYPQSAADTSLTFLATLSDCAGINHKVFPFLNLRTLFNFNVSQSLWRLCNKSNKTKHEHMEFLFSCSTRREILYLNLSAPMYYFLLRNYKQFIISVSIYQLSL